MADYFAMAHRLDPYRGGAILQTLAPPEAIICRVPLSLNNEMEYVVDSRRLQRVETTRLPNTDHWSIDTINDGWEDRENEDDEPFVIQ